MPFARGSTVTLALEGESMQRASIICAVLMLGTPLASLACRELAVFPEHLDADDIGHYYIVRVERSDGANFRGKVERSFGGPFSSGQAVTITFRTNEEAHAVCPIELVAGKTYLLRSESTAGTLEISRFNWLNVPADHDRFKVYVQDLERLQQKR